MTAGVVCLVQTQELTLNTTPRLIALISISELSAKRCGPVSTKRLLCTTLGVNCTLRLHLLSRIYGVVKKQGKRTGDTITVAKNSSKLQRLQAERKRMDGKEEKTQVMHHTMRRGFFKVSVLKETFPNQCLFWRSRSLARNVGSYFQEA